MEKKIYVSLSPRQKGGAGKTTLTVLVASYLHYVRGYDVAVVDCDYPQYSIHEIAGTRPENGNPRTGYYKSLAYEQFTRLNKKMYPVVKSCRKRLPQTAKALLEKGKFDIYFL